MKPYRKEKLASLIRTVVGEALIHRLSDPRIETLTTVSRVEMTTDLQVARVFISVPGGESSERKTMAAIESAHGLLQRLVADNVSMRQCPKLRFEIDELGKRALATLHLIEQNRQAREANEEKVEEDDWPSDGDEDTAGEIATGSGHAPEQEKGQAGESVQREEPGEQV
ncbi:MAG: 30S ribosome-binding factor RbfA [Planctomycetota bacterium]|jgi:ribosome-binding factor A